MESRRIAFRLFSYNYEWEQLGRVKWNIGGLPAPIDRIRPSDRFRLVMLLIVVDPIPHRAQLYTLLLTTEPV
jgi:hypothetical protein